MPLLINNNNGCKKWIPKNNHNLHMKGIKKTKNYIKNLINKQVKLTNYKNCYYYSTKFYKINNTTDLEHQKIKNSKNDLLNKLKKIYGNNFNIFITISRNSNTRSFQYTTTISKEVYPSYPYS
jgi:hypothetical protein